MTYFVTVTDADRYRELHPYPPPAPLSYDSATPASTY
jgi:hypothetical protein